MAKRIVYRTRGTCSRAIEVEINDEGIITDASFQGGCSGNTQGVARLVIGMKAEDAAEKLSGIRCGFRDTSCPDQLAKAISEALKQ